MKILEFLKKRFANRDEQGSGLVTILGVSLVVALIAGVVTTSSATTSLFASTQLSKQQAKDYADSATTEAVSSILNNKCSASGNQQASTSAGDGTPQYKYFYKIYSSNQIEKPSASDFTTGNPSCPAQGDRWVLIVSNGYGRNNTTEEVKSIYQIYGNGRNMNSQAMLSGSISLTNNSSVSKVSSSSLSNPNIVNDSGDFICNESTISGNLKNTAVYSTVTTANCIINGNYNSFDSIALDKTSTVSGDVCTYSSNASCNLDSSNYGYDMDMDTAENVITPSSCSKSIIRSSISSLGKGDNPKKHYIVDLRKCANVSGSVSNILVYSDMTIILSPTYSSKLENFSFSNSATNPENHTIDFVVTSSSGNESSATCEKSGITTTLNGITFGDGIKGNFYTPCSFSFTNSDVTGQFYAGVSLAGSTTKFTYSPVEFYNATVDIKDVNKIKDLVRVG